MDPAELKDMGLETLAIHAGEGGDPHTGALETPVHLSSVFVPGGAQEHEWVLPDQAEHLPLPVAQRKILDLAWAALEARRGVALHAPASTS